MKASMKVQDDPQYCEYVANNLPSWRLRACCILCIGIMGYCSKSRDAHRSGALVPRSRLGSRKRARGPSIPIHVPIGRYARNT